ncbi:MAG: 16S rRNA (cytosine(1402)-N(4))-methyltransferase RsmH, partial [Campylobacterota bacterium]|nr:16S rRNA (cytosine(1402)-N(4))-methyltransferase RsmH [Campylobacterota bacterium]
MEIPHIPVLFDEVIECFDDLEDGFIIDCTLGYGGHSKGILEHNPNIQLIANDQDDTALNFSAQRLKEYSSRIEFNKGNFEHVIEKFSTYPIRGILADIGVSSLQLDEQTRGFGFNSDVLDMRMDQDSDLSARDVVNNYSQVDLEKILKEYGEVKEYKKV